MQINVKYVNPPKPGGKYGSLRLTDGAYLSCPPNLLPHFQAGASYDVPTVSETWGKGTDARNVLIVAGPPGSAQGLVQGQGSQGYQGAPTPHQAAVRPNLSVVGGASAQLQNAHPPVSNNTGREIFVTGVVGRAMGSGKFAASEIDVLAQAAVAAWEKLNRPPVEEPPPPAWEETI